MAPQVYDNILKKSGGFQDGATAASRKSILKLAPFEIKGTCCSDIFTL